jgi:hypothetical protein
MIVPPSRYYPKSSAESFSLHICRRLEHFHVLGNRGSPQILISRCQRISLSHRDLKVGRIVRRQTVLAAERLRFFEDIFRRCPEPHLFAIRSEFSSAF